MAEKNSVQERRHRGNFPVTRFNCQTGIGIYLLDLDHSGAKLEAPFPLSLEYPVEFCFSLPGYEMEFQVAGRVMSKQQVMVPPGKYHLRVQFYAPRWDLDAVLKRDAL